MREQRRTRANCFIILPGFGKSAAAARLSRGRKWKTEVRLSYPRARVRCGRFFLVPSCWGTTTYSVKVAKSLQERMFPSACWKKSRNQHQEQAAASSSNIIAISVCKIAERSIKISLPATLLSQQQQQQQGTGRS